MPLGDTASAGGWRGGSKKVSVLQPALPLSRGACSDGARRCKGRGGPGPGLWWPSRSPAVALSWAGLCPLHVPTSSLCNSGCLLPVHFPHVFCPISFPCQQRLILRDKEKTSESTSPALSYLTAWGLSLLKGFAPKPQQVV